MLMFGLFVFPIIVSDRCGDDDADGCERSLQYGAVNAAVCGVDCDDSDQASARERECENRFNVLFRDNWCPYICRKR